MQSGGPGLFELSDGTDVASEVESCICRLGESSIRIPDPQTVMNYLRQHPDMAQLAIHAAALARQDLGCATDLSLEMYSDPEIRDEHLVLYARREQYDSAFRKGVRRVADQLSPCLEAASGWLLVATDYRQPTTV